MNIFDQNVNLQQEMRVFLYNKLSPEISKIEDSTELEAVMLLTLYWRATNLYYAVCKNHDDFSEGRIGIKEFASSVKVFDKFFQVYKKLLEE